MSQTIQLYYEKFLLFFSEDNLATLKATLQPHIQQLQELHFSFTNPVFGLLLLLVFLLLLKKWGRSKAFSYCLLVSSILCLDTGLEGYFVTPIAESGVLLSDIIHAIVYFAVIVITLYYAMIRNE